MSLDMRFYTTTRNNLKLIEIITNVAYDEANEMHKIAKGGPWQARTQLIHEIGFIHVAHTFAFVIIWSRAFQIKTLQFLPIVRVGIVVGIVGMEIGRYSSRT